MYILLGAGGYLGYIFATHLSSNSQSFLTVSRSFQWEQVHNERRFVADVGNTLHYVSNIPDNSTLIYMAGATNLSLAEQLGSKDIFAHTEQMQMVFTALKAKNVRLNKAFFFSSSGAIYGNSNGIMQTEDSRLEPISIYGKRNQHLECLFENNCLSMNVAYSCLRISNPYGSKQALFRRKGLIHTLINSCKFKHPVRLRAAGTQVRDYLHEDNLIEILMALSIAKSLPSRINLSSGYSYSALELVEILNKNNLYPIVELDPFSPPYEVSDSLVNNNLLLDCIELRKDFFITVDNFISDSDYI